MHALPVSNAPSSAGLLSPPLSLPNTPVAEGQLLHVVLQQLEQRLRMLIRKLRGVVRVVVAVRLRGGVSSGGVVCNMSRHITAVI